MNYTYNPNKVIVHGTFINPHTFFIWGEQKKQKKYQEFANFMYPFLFSPFELKLMLYRYHQASFYGTFIELDKVLIQVPLLERQFYSEVGNVPVYQANTADEHYLFPIEGITISADEIPNHIETIKSWTTAEEWIIADDLAFWIAFFSQIQKEITAGLILPKQDGHWKLTSFDFEEWHNSLPPSALSIRKQSTHIRHQENHFILEDGLETLSNEIADRLIRFLIKNNKEVQHALLIMKEQKSDLITSLIDSLEQQLPPVAQQGLEETVLLEELGIVARAPFLTGIEVKEPMNNTEPWKISLFVQDRQDPSIIVSMQELHLGKHPWTVNPIPKIKQDIKLGATKVPIIRELSPMKEEIDLSNEEVYQFLIEGAKELQQLGFTIFVPTWMRQWRKDYAVKVKLEPGQSFQNSGVDPFMNWSSLTSFEYDVSVNGTTLTEDEFTKLVKSKEALVYVRGKWLMWDPASAKRLKKQIDKKKDKQISFFDAWQAQLQKETSRSQEPINDDEPFDIEWEVDWDEQTEQMLHVIQKKEIDILEPPLSLHGDLRPYQQEGYSWLISMRKIGFGACLADDMGLGKSIQTIAYLLKVLETQKEQKETHEPFLLICPTSLIGNWVYELQQFAPNLRVFIHHGDTRLTLEEIVRAQYDIIITSYALAVRDEEIWTMRAWNGLILDEAQQLKNVQTKQRRSIKKIHAAHRIALTGTPIENRLIELWSMIDLLNHGFLGTFRHFQQTFIKEIEGAVKNDTRLQQLQQLISPFLMRRKKSDPSLELQLPDKNEQTYHVGLTVEQASLYQVVVNELLDNVNKVTELERRALILSSLTKLKQICNHPAQFLKDNGPLSNRSEKWELLITLLEQIIDNQEKTLIFSQYKEMGELLQQGIMDLMGIEVPFLHGTLTRKKREELIASFKSDKDKPIFILSLKAGGVGLNLTAANHVIHYDRWWNPAVENQATDRAYRIGQKQHVTVHKMVTKGTLEERIDQMLKKKQLLADEVLASGEGKLSELSHEELKELLELRG